MLDIQADLFVGALSHFSDVLQDLGIVNVMEQLKMFSFIGVPFEFSILDFVFPVVWDIGKLRKNLCNAEE
jgi:hypothetical protein